MINLTVQTAVNTKSFRSVTVRAMECNGLNNERAIIKHVTCAAIKTSIIDVADIKPRH